MDWVLVLSFVWLFWLPRYVQAGVASVVLERACEVYQNPGQYLSYQGERKTLTCSWNGTTPVKTFVWTLNGNVFTDYTEYSRDERKQRIQIRSLNDTHEGTFSCSLRTEENETASASFQLALQGLPEIIPLPEDPIHGGNITLTCRHGIINVTRIKWFEDGNSLYGLSRSWVEFSGNDTYSESVTVNLNRNPDEPSEKYECQVESELMCGGRYKLQRVTDMRRSTPPFVVDIKYPIELSLNIARTNVVVQPCEDTNINCQHHSGDHPSTVNWYKLIDGVKTPLDQVDTVQSVSLRAGDNLLKIFSARKYMEGTYSCEGWNAYGKDVKTITVSVPDSENPMLQNPSEIYPYSESRLPGVGKAITLTCVDHDPTIDMDQSSVEWFKDGSLLQQNGGSKTLKIPYLQKSDQGAYSCKYSARGNPIKFYSEEYYVNVVDYPPQPMELLISANHTTENSLLITWGYVENTDTIATSVKIRADFANPNLRNADTALENTIPCSTEDGECPDQFTIRGLAPGTRYEIFVISVNDLGETDSEPVTHETNIAQQLTESNPEEFMKLVVGIVAGLLVLVCILGYVFFRRHKTTYKKKIYDKIEREMGFTIPKNTMKSDSKEYDYKQLIFLDEIGEGAFGKVLKAEAPGLKCLQGGQTVAVKMCREENEYDRLELLSEIEILSKLGVHQHVIPLLGVCTKTGRPTCLITQYMPDGDLQDYLRHSRPSFVGTYPFRPQTADSFQPNIHKMSNLCTSDDSITSKDLISFARQIACGMEYVASQKIVHRDLAARNVLVASKRSLKITDFGLAREMRGVNEEYVMGPNRKVPYRWLAPESFFDKRFTVYSDVWAYGILLYEILTLGGSPYPRHTIRDIPEMLKQGYRMSPPSNSKPELNCLMAMCWHQIPESRPSFSEIKSLLDELLGDRPDEYLDCGDPSAEVVPNLNSADNQEVNGDRHLRYSFLRESVSQRDLISSIAVQGYDRIADAHSAYGTLTVGGTANNNTDTAASNNTAFAFNPLLAQIKSNPIPETYQHLPVIEPSPESARSQYVNHETRPNRGGDPVIVKQDFRCGTENFVAQKL